MDVREGIGRGVRTGRGSTAARWLRPLPSAPGGRWAPLTGGASPTRRAGGAVPAPEPTQVLRVRSADGTGLHVETYGPRDAPTVVLSHGWICSTLMWAPVLRALGDTVRVVLYDQRGHGRSEEPRREGYSTTALADDLCAVLEATVPPQTRAVAAGHSMGAMTLMAAAERSEFRSRTAAVLLASTGSGRLTAEARVIGGPEHRFTRLRDACYRLALTAPVPLAPLTPLARAGLRHVTMTPKAHSEAVELCAHIMRTCRPIPRARWGAVLSTLDLAESLHRLDMPSRVLTGSADRLTPPTHARRIAEALPHCEGLTLLSGVGHMTPLEAPDRFGAVLRELVDDHLTASPGAGRASGTAARPA